jgi:hypothetical protein
MGQAQVIYRLRGDVTRWVAANIVPASFAMFRGGFSGSALVQVVNARGVSPVQLAQPAGVGETVVLWGSGLGQTAAGDVRVSVGDVPQKVLYAGRAPGTPGVDQINVQLSNDVAVGCYVPLTIAYGLRTVTSTMSISRDGGACAHPFGLTVLELRSLDGGSPLWVGTLNTDSSVVMASEEHASRVETASINLIPYSGVSVASWIARGRQQPGCYLVEPYGAALIGGILGGIAPQTFGRGVDLSNGSVALRFEPLQGPANSTATLPGPENGPPGTLPPPVLAGGIWTVEPFAAKTTLPAPVRIADAPGAVRGDTDATVRWNGSVYGAGMSATLTISGANPGTGASAAVRCDGPASAGGLTVPASLLSKLPVSSGTLTLQVSSNAVIPIATVREPADSWQLSTIVLLPNHSTSESRPVDIQREAMQ